MVKQEAKVTVYSIIVFLLATLFYPYEFALQISPGVMTEALMRDFKVSALGLSVLSSFYYYAYTPMQLPAGVLYDRLGPRLLLGYAVLLCALGALFQPLVGWLLHKVWQGTLINEVPVYSVANFQAALMVLPLCYFLALIIGIKRLRESYR